MDAKDLAGNSGFPCFLYFCKKKMNGNEKKHFNKKYN
jgi:hypothetical protein